MSTNNQDQIPPSIKDLDISDNEGNEDIILYKRDNSCDERSDSQEDSTMSLPFHLSYLYGTEEIVDMRRQLVFLREKLWKIQLRDRAGVVCGGSLGEGVAFPSSDDDVMMYRTCYRVVKSLAEGTQDGDLLMAAVGGNPGYCLLYDIKGPYDGDKSKNTLFCYMGNPLLSSSDVKQAFLTTAGGDRIHGPCSTFAVGPDEYDQAFSIPCSFWPNAAQEWIDRRRPYGWPSQAMIHKIKMGNCHVVPIGNPDSPLVDHEWRVSFLVAERLLMHSFNHCQFLTYNLLRTALKKKIEVMMEDVLSSYFMKTILFHTIENTTRQLWMLDNLETCFQTCLSMLYNNIESMNLPNYFIPENNMIRRKLNQTNTPLLLQCVQSLRKDGILGVLRLTVDSERIQKSISLSEMEWKQDFDFFHSNHLHKLIGLIQAEICISAGDSIEPYVSADCNKFSKCLKRDENFTRYKYSDILHQSLHVTCCLKLMHDIYNCQRQEEHEHNANYSIESLLQSGPKGDMSSGMLTLATYQYFSGKAESALSTVRQLFSEYPPYVLDELLKRGVKRDVYQDVICGRGYSLDEKAKLAWAPLYYMPYSLLNAFPHPLKLLLQTGKHLRIQPLTYALFLECLCYLKLENQLLVMKATKCLVQQMDDMYSSFGIACVRICVGIIKYLQGDNQSACRWFGSAYVMKKKIELPYDKRLPLAALTYIGCLINKSRYLDCLNQSCSC